MNIAKTVVVAGFVAAMFVSASAQTDAPPTAVATPAPPKLTATIYVSNGNSVTAYAPGSYGNVAPINVISDRSDLLRSPWGIALDSAGNIYVASFDSGGRGAISMYKSGSSGVSVPTATISGMRTGLDNPFGLAVDSSGKIYVANFAGGKGGGSVTVYSANSNGDVAPTATIIGDDTGLDNPSGIALDSNGKIYVANRGGGRTSASSITVYAAGSSGNVKPIATIAGPRTRLDDPCIAVDPSGKIYAGNASDSVTVYTAGSNGDVSPIANIAGPDTGDKTGLSQPNGIALDSKGNIYVANAWTKAADSTENPEDPSDNVFSVTVYRPGSTGNVKPIATLRGSGVGVEAIALDSSGKIYVTQFGFDVDDDSGGTITILSPSRKGDAETVATIRATGQTGIRWAHGIAVDQRGKIYIANGLDGGNNIEIFSAGSRGNVAPVATIEGADTGLHDPLGVAVDSEGKIYVTNPAKEVLRDQRMVTGPSSITTYAEGTNGDVKPIATITGVIKSYTPHDLGWLGQGPDRHGSQEWLAEQWQRTVDRIDASVLYDPDRRTAQLRELQIQRLTQMQQQMGASMPESYQHALRQLQIQSSSQPQSTKPIPTPIPGRRLWAWIQSSPINAVPEFCMYAIGDDGEVTRQVFWDSDCLLDFSEGIAIDKNGNLYLPSSECFGGNVERVTVAAPGSSGSGKPTVTIIGSAGSPQGIVVDKHGNIYVTNNRLSANSITVYPAGSRDRVTPIANIAGRDTLLNGPRAIALDSSGKIYVANGGGSVTVYPAGSNGDAQPIATISGSDTGLVRPTGIAVDSDGNIYVTTEEGGPDRSASVNIYTAGSDGDAVPIGIISGSLTGLSQPAGIALGPPIESQQ